MKKAIIIIITYLVVLSILIGVLVGLLTGGLGRSIGAGAGNFIVGAGVIYLFFRAILGVPREDCFYW